MTGSIAATDARVTKGWFTDIESTNMPSVGGTALNTALAMSGASSLFPADPGADKFLMWDDDPGQLVWADAGAGSGATTALDNLASVAINTSLVSDTDNTDALGTAAIAWSDLFLGNGSVITWTSAPSTADVTLTHSANALTLAGGDLALGANNLTMTGSIAATDARVTKGWFTDIESTNMPSVGGTALNTALAMSGASSLFPADPGADRYLMWDDDPGALVWAEGGGGSGDVTDVGDCTGGVCLDGTSDGGTWIKFYDAQGAGQLITGDLTEARTWTLPDTTGTIALTANKLSAFAATTSAELAGVISNETGTGSLVFGTSPTFTTSVIVSDGATIGQEAGPLIAFDDTNDYLEITGAKVGIGTTTPVYQLDITGRISASTGFHVATKDDAGALASGSGFFETSSPTNYYTGATSWQHLIESRHNNDGNNYALQIAGSFFDQNLYFRKTNNSATTAWTAIGAYSVGSILLASADTEESLTNAGWTQSKAITINRGGALRIYFELRNGYNTSAPVYAAIFRNGAQVGTTRSDTNTTYDGYTEDITGWSPGDSVQLYFYAWPPTLAAYVRNFRIYVNASDATAVTNADVAEWYNISDASIDFGDVVSIDKDIGESSGQDPPQHYFVKKSSASYQSDIMGIVSADAGVKLGDNGDTENQRQVALVGRVPVKISLENGPIKIGDPLTSSSVPGLAMKATEPGMIIGVALEAYESEQPDGKAMVFVNPHWSINEGILSSNNTDVDVNLATISNKFVLTVKNILEKLGLFVENGIARIKEVIAEKITTKEFCIEGEDGEKVCVNKDQLKGLLNNGIGSSASSSEPTVVPESSIDNFTQPDEVSEESETSEQQPVEIPSETVAETPADEQPEETPVDIPSETTETLSEQSTETPTESAAEQSSTVLDEQSQTNEGFAEETPAG
jgi:hypothetical protein